MEFLHEVPQTCLTAGREVTEKHGGSMIYQELSNKIIGCAIEVHKQLGPGLLESAYEECLAYELIQAGLNIERQKPIPVVYKEVKLEC